MASEPVSRRNFMATTSKGAIAAAALGQTSGADAAGQSLSGKGSGSQRLSLERLKSWEELGYGMFVHFGMSTFVGNEIPDGKAPVETYAPERLDVDQWVSVARDAGMKYMVLTAKHVAGHCLWPSECTGHTVANSTDKTDVVEAFVKSCEKRGVLPGFYYCSWDNHNTFGSVTPTYAPKGASWSAMNSFPAGEDFQKPLPAYTTSLYQSFQTAQVTELLTRYGPIFETWIDIPGILGRGYRTFLYEKIVELQPDTHIMMNSGISDGTNYDVAYAWPSDLMALERNVPPGDGHQPWREIEGKDYYIAGEVCDPIGKEWFCIKNDRPRSDEELLEQFQKCRDGGANLLLNVPPDKTGTIPDYYVEALMRLRKNAGL